MLAFVQQQPPDLYTRTMSLAVLPSSPASLYTSQHDLPAKPPSPAKRPKLSLDTSSVAPTTFGKKSTSLRLETLSATSPTVRNTFSNAHEQKASKLRLTPITTTFSDSPTVATPVEDDLFTPAEATRRIGSSGSVSSVSTVDSYVQDVPYKLPFNHASILKNGPVDRRPTQTTTFAQSRPMFPPTKKVGFKAPLTEEIKTSRFTLKHSDIESSASTISTLDLTQSKEDQDVEAEAEEVEVVERPKDVKRVETEAPSPHTGDKRESSDEEDSDNESYPTTPMAGRRKRHRQWRWTLGPDGSADSSVGTLSSPSTEGPSDGEVRKEGS